MKLSKKIKKRARKVARKLYSKSVIDNNVVDMKLKGQDPNRYVKVPVKNPKRGYVIDNEDHYKGRYLNE